MSVEPVGGNNGPQCGTAGVVDRLILAIGHGRDSCALEIRV